MGDTRAAPAAPYGCKRTAPKDDLWRRVGWPDGWSAEADWRMPGDVVGRAEGEEHGRCGEGSSQHSANCLRRVRGPPCCHSGGPPATMGGQSAQQRPHSGRPQFEGGRPEGGPAAQARRPGRPIGPPDFRGWPPTFGWRAARFWSEGRPIWRLGGPGGGRAARSPLTADSTTYRTPVPRAGEYDPADEGEKAVSVDHHGPGDLTVEGNGPGRATVRGNPMCPRLLKN